MREAELFTLVNVDTQRSDLKELIGSEFSIRLGGLGAHATFDSADKGTWHTSWVVHIERGDDILTVKTRNSTYYFAKEAR